MRIEAALADIEQHREGSLRLAHDIYPAEAITRAIADCVSFCTVEVTECEWYSVARIRLEDAENPLPLLGAFLTRLLVCSLTVQESRESNGSR